MGVLASQDIKELINNESIISEVPIVDSQIQPASLDLRFNGEIKCLSHGFAAGNSNIKLSQMLESEDFAFPIYPYRDGDYFLLKQGFTYILGIEESLNIIDRHISARANSKSSTGRLFIYSRLITEHGNLFDSIGELYKGKLYLIVEPMSFDIVIRKYDSLHQVRFIESEYGSTLYSKYIKLELETEIVGYSPKLNGLLSPIDIRVKNSYTVDHYFHNVIPVDYQNTKIVRLSPRYRYFFSSKAGIEIRPWECAELKTFEPTSREFVLNHRGFFDPGFGHGYKDITRATFEIVPLVPMILTDGQIVGELEFYEMKNVPESLYRQ